MDTEESWMEAEGFHYVETDEHVLDVEYEYVEEDTYKPLNHMFRDNYFPSEEDWAYYTNESWD